MHEIMTLVLAGGQAKRFPGKLDMRLDGTPLLLRVLHNVRDFAPLAIAGRKDLAVSLQATMDFPVLFDAYPGSGPLGAVLSSFEQLDARYIAVLAGDMPHVTTAEFTRLATFVDPMHNGVIATCEGQREPLFAIYDRVATLMIGRPLFEGGERSVAALAGALALREVPVRRDIVANINRREDALLHFSSVEGPA